MLSIVDIFVYAKVLVLFGYDEIGRYLFGYAELCWYYFYFFIFFIIFFWGGVG